MCYGTLFYLQFFTWQSHEDSVDETQALADSGLDDLALDLGRDVDETHAGGDVEGEMPGV